MFFFGGGGGGVSQLKGKRRVLVRAACSEGSKRGPRGRGGGGGGGGSRLRAISPTPTHDTK